MNYVIVSKDIVLRSCIFLPLASPSPNPQTLICWLLRYHEQKREEEIMVKKALTWVGSYHWAASCSACPFPSGCFQGSSGGSQLGLNCNFNAHFPCLMFLLFENREKLREASPPCTHIAGVPSPRMSKWTDLKMSAASLSLHIAHIWSMGNTHPLSNQTKVVQTSPTQQPSDSIKMASF